jgi:hypothetical protein
MTNISDLNKYKTAKLIVNDLHGIIHLLNNCKRDLTSYHKYLPVQDVESVITNSLTLINLHLNKYQDILNNKGTLDDKMD